MSESPLLKVDGMSVAFRTDAGVVRAVTDVSFEINSGEVLAVVGESGSGKSVTALALMRLHPKNTDITGSVMFDGIDVLSLSEDEMRSIRGRDVAMIFQDPMTAMNPVYTVGEQIAEAIRIHSDTSKQGAWDRAVDLLQLVGVPEPKRRASQHPHEFSGGMRQRAMIAMAICNDPKLLIADEPTTALDVTVQAQVMDVLHDVQQATGSAMMLITHDLGLVAGFGRPRPGDVREPPDGDRRPRRHLLRVAQPVHPGAAQLDPGPRGSQGVAAGHSREPAEPAEPSVGLRIPAPVRRSRSTSVLHRIRRWSSSVTAMRAGATERPKSASTSG